MIYLTYYIYIYYNLHETYKTIINIIIFYNSFIYLVKFHFKRNLSDVFILYS
jgi:hypothetical protein